MDTFYIGQTGQNHFHWTYKVSDWNNWPHQCLMNTFISTTTLQPSRYALAYTPLTNESVYVDVAFIALDA